MAAPPPVVVTIALHDGTEHAWLQPTRKGDPDLPLSDADLQAKPDELASPVLGTARLREVGERLWRLGESGDLGFF